jgi:hypothetical protein
MNGGAPNYVRSPVQSLVKRPWQAVELLGVGGVTNLLHAGGRKEHVWCKRAEDEVYPRPVKRNDLFTGVYSGLNAFG